MDRMRVERVGALRDLCATISGTGREVPDFHGWWSTTALEQERQGNLLRVVGQQDDGGPGEVVAGWPVAGKRNSGGAVPGSHCRRPPAWHEQAAIRRNFRWPAIPGESGCGRRRGLAHHAHLQLEAASNEMNSRVGRT